MKIRKESHTTLERLGLQITIFLAIMGFLWAATTVPISNLVFQTNVNAGGNSLTNVNQVVATNSVGFQGNASSANYANWAANSSNVSGGTLTFTPVTNSVASYLQGSNNGMYQFMLQNSNAGTNASADFVVNNNLSSNTGNYGEFGINSSTYGNGTGSLNQSNTVFLTATSEDLALGTISSNAVHFVVNNGSNDALTIAAAGGVEIPITGLLKGNGSSSPITAAVSGTDYAPATTGTNLYYGNGSGGWSPVTIGSGITFSGGTLSASSGSGTLTAFSAGNLSPLFTTSVATSTTTPAMTFTLTSASANLVFASPNGSSGVGSYRALMSADIPTLNQNTTGSAFSVTGAFHGDVTGTQSAMSVNAINSTSMAGLGSGVLFNTTGTGVPSIATANQLAAGLTGTTGTLNLASSTLTIPALTLPNGTTATTQTGADSSTKLATDAFVAGAVSGVTSIYVPVRQTVLAGPIDTTYGVPTYISNVSFPTSGLSLTTYGVGSNAPYSLVATSANGFNSSGAVNVVGIATSNLTWSSLAASGTDYLYVTISGGTLTTGSTTLAPIYEYAGTPSNTNGQFTFLIGQMMGYMGNGSTAPQANIVFVGEVTAGSSTITTGLAYAFQGLYDSGYTATLPTSTATSWNANLGYSDNVLTAFRIKCTTANDSYAVGDVLPQWSLNMESSGGVSYQQGLQMSGRNTVQLNTSASWWTIPKGGAASGISSLTVGDWSYAVNVKRGW